MDACGGEEALYTPVKDFLEHRFQALVKPALGEVFPLSAITAHAGGQTGRWTKPDLCFVALWRHKFKPSWKLEHFPTGRNHLGFTKAANSDSCCGLAEEASPHDKTSVE